MADSWAAIRPLIFNLVGSRFDAAAASATEYYLHARVLADLGVIRVPQVRLAGEELAKSLDSMAMGTFFHQLEQVDDLQAATIASRALQAAGGRLVLKGGRQTIATASVDDPAALGWERVVSAGSCSFCAMLAGRGGVYKDDTVKFRAHDHCDCTAEPVFRGQKAVGSNLAAEWKRVTSGKSGKAAIAAWDQHWEGRNEQPNDRAAEEASPIGQGHAAELQQ